MLTWLKSLFFRRAPTGPQQKLRAFSLNEGTISKGCVRVENDNWRIDSAENQTVRLFDLQHPEVEQCLLTYLSSRDQEREPERPRISGDVVPPARSRRVLFEGPAASGFQYHRLGRLRNPVLPQKEPATRSNQT